MIELLFNWQFQIICLLGCIVGISKAVGDIVDHKWGISVFSRFKEDSFFGSQEGSADRKNWPSNKFLRLLTRTVFVWVTDIWHFANMVEVVAILGCFLTCTQVDYFCLYGLEYPSAMYLFRQACFKLFYNKILLK